MPFPPEVSRELETVYRLFPGEVDDVEAMIRRGDSDEQIAEFLAGDQAHRLSADQYLNAAHRLRATLR